jgi:hypothetical protein
MVATNLTRALVLPFNGAKLRLPLRKGQAGSRPMQLPGQTALAGGVAVPRTRGRPGAELSRQVLLRT